MAGPKKIMLVAGARPNFMKVAPPLQELGKHPEAFRPQLIHTGQHYDPEMSDVFFRELDLPRPDRVLGVGSGSHAEQTARVMKAFEQTCIEERPDLVVVVGMSTRRWRVPLPLKNSASLWPTSSPACAAGTGPCRKKSTES